jgi:hypothetical protein
MPLTLWVTRDLNRDRPIKRNDIRDINWLAISVPYGNLFVAEKDWAHMVRRNGFDARCRATIITDASELPARLREMRCL